MIVKGIEKFTTLDYPGKLACTLFLFGCNLRCGYCHNPDLVIKNDLTSLSEEKILDFLAQRQGLLEGVCITGGEPLATVQISFIKKIRELGFSIKLDTNGSFPERLQECITAGVIDYIAMDIKATPELYPKLAGKVDIAKLEQSMRIIAKFPQYEFRTTVIPHYHNIKNMQQMRDWVLQATRKKQLKAYYLQGFVARQGGMIDSSFEQMASPSQKILEEMKKIWQPYAEICEIR